MSKLLLTRPSLLPQVLDDLADLIAKPSVTPQLAQLLRDLGPDLELAARKGQANE